MQEEPREPICETKLSEASFSRGRIHYAFCSYTKQHVRAAVGDKREAILRAAISVFAHNGYFNSKVADIAREAGVADGTVYLYFKSKEDILHSIFDRSVEEALDAARKQIERRSRSKRKTAPDRVAASRATRRRSRSRRRFSGRVARLDEVYGRVFRGWFCRVSRR